MRLWLQSQDILILINIEIVQVNLGEEQHVYLQFTYDKDNDRISCALQEKDVETGEYVTGYTVIFTRVNG